MTSSEAYRKLNAQTDLAARQVQPLLEQLIAELAVSRPTDPISALIARLEEMEKADADAATRALSFRPPRHILSVVGCPGSGKTTQSTLAAGTRRASLLLSIESLTDEALRGGVSRKGYEDIHIPQDLQLSVLEAAQQNQPIPTATVVALTRNRIELAEQALLAPSDATGSGAASGPSSESAPTPASGLTDGPLLFVLDGYPRSMEEAMALEAAVGAVSHVVQLGCAPETGSHRARAAGTTEAALADQWARFERNTAPLVEYWRALRKFTMADGEADKLVCARSIKALLQ